MLERAASLQRPTENRALDRPIFVLRIMLQQEFVVQDENIVLCSSGILNVRLA